MNPIQLVLWVHIVCMISALGALLATQTVLTPDIRNHPNTARSIARLVNILIGIGFLGGISYYALLHGHTMGPHYNGVIGVKFVFLLGAGSLIGISKKNAKGDLFRWCGFGLLLLASLFGATL